MPGSVVCGVDDSDGARSALRVADDLALKLGLKLVLVHGTPVAPSVLYGVPFDSDAFQRQALEEAEQLLESASRTCKSPAVTRRAELGEPTMAIERVLEEEDAYLLVVGTRGRGAMRSVLLGSVAHEMLAIAHCPVVVVSPRAVS